MIEGSDQLDVRRKQHAIAKDISAHVAYADNAKRLSLGVVSHFPKVSLDRLPSTLGSNAHPFVVITR